MSILLQIVQDVNLTAQELVKCTQPSGLSFQCHANSTFKSELDREELTQKIQLSITHA